MTEALAAVADGRMTVLLDEVLALGNVNDAFARLADRQVAGKLVLDLQR
jgi:D-arabinose 1-dehydrogenase-like Zn-dependent alcohol dehydrogenase